MSRRYMTHRRAYWPVMWPLIVFNGAVGGVLGYFLRPIWLMLLIISALSWGLPQLRLWIWKRQHPIISAEEYLQDMRSKATWN